MCSPSSGLLLRRAEHSAGRAGAPELPDEHQDELVPEAAAPVQHPADAHQPEPYAWDAWDGVHPDAADVADLRPASWDVGAGKLADPALDALAQDASSRQAIQSEQSKPRARPDAEAELCKPDAVQSAEQSCAAPEAAADPQPQVVQVDAAQPRKAEAKQTLESQAQPSLEAPPRPPAAVWPAAGQLPELPLTPQSAARLESQSQPAFPPPERPLPASPPAQAVAEPELLLRPLESGVQPEAGLAGPPAAQSLAWPQPLAEQLRAAAALPLPSSA